MIQIFMLIRVFFTIFYTTSCADCLCDTSRGSSCMLTNISTLAANSIFPLMIFLCNRHYSTVITLLFMCLCCLSPFLCSCMLATILAHAAFSIFPIVQSIAILCLWFIFYRACLICALMPMIRIIIRPSSTRQMLMKFYII